MRAGTIGAGSCTGNRKGAGSGSWKIFPTRQGAGIRSWAAGPWELGAGKSGSKLLTFLKNNL